MLAGAFLAFYAFLGFEDMVNIAEEVEGVERAMPLGIALTLGVTVALYVPLALVAVSALPTEALDASPAPLAELYRQVTGRDPWPISAVAVIAILNGALIQMIMASRVLSGLAEQGMPPAKFGRVHARTRTPLVATAVVTATVLVLALSFPVERLAAATSAVTLVVFIAVNVALWRVKRAAPAPRGLFRVPRWLPPAGAVTSAGFLLMALLEAMTR